MATVSIDPKIKLKLCPELCDIAKEIFEDDLEVIDTVQLKTIRNHIKIPGEFNDLVSKCELILPQPEVAPRNPELEARIQKLKNQQAQREYDKMTDNVDPWRKMQILEKDDKPIGQQSKQIFINFKRFHFTNCFSCHSRNLIVIGILKLYNDTAPIHQFLVTLPHFQKKS